MSRLRRSQALRHLSDDQLARALLRGLVVEQDGCLYPTVSGAAISTPTERYAQSRATQGASTTFSPTGTIAVGSLAVIAWTTGLAGGKAPTSITDNAGGNTWNLNVTGYDGTQQQCGFASCHVATQLTTGTVITINWTPSTNNQVHIWLQEVTASAPSSAFDKSAAGFATSNSFSAGATPTLSQADEIVFAVVRQADMTGWTPTGGFTSVTTPTLAASGMEYLIVSSTAAVTATATVTNGGAWEMVAATYKGLAPAGDAIPARMITAAGGGVY